MKDLDEYIKAHRTTNEKKVSFVEYLFSLLEKYGISKNSELILQANLTKQNFSQIISGKVKPSLNTCLKIVFALKLTNHECKYLLKKAGYTLASSSEFALIIRYCIEKKIYEIYEVNEFLNFYGCEKLNKKC